VKPARDIDSFIARRVGRYFVGGHYLFWCADATIGGMAFWGEPDDKDVGEVARILDRAPVQPGADARFDVVTDGRRIDRLSKLAFERYAKAAVRRIREQQRRLLNRHAIIAPEGLIGTVMAGFFPLHELGDNYRLFHDAAVAFDWLGRGGILAEVESLITEHLGEKREVLALRRWLAGHLDAPSVEVAARALALSARSLQRQLSQAGTSFRRELDRARVERASLRLLESDDQLEAIARHVGCSSLSAFSRVFRRATGESPRAYRARKRAENSR
jgi:AraC-like DNA-binding protein